MLGEVLTTSADWRRSAAPGGDRQRADQVEQLFAGGCQELINRTYAQPPAAAAPSPARRSQQLSADLHTAGPLTSSGEDTHRACGAGRGPPQRGKVHTPQGVCGTMPDHGWQEEGHCRPDPPVTAAGLDGAATPPTLGRHPTGGGRPVAIPCTPGEYRSVANTKALLRRVGAKV
ncbi:hypothetical protein GCM10012275_42520 [Longimycelium tulufanense]|uniref:Uncharacterized protein n=1 Tax=Longimycelium tulufanense TaxID=907463 RepID=A0A8J3CGW4_9PSEU|nr:hypothetical protein [Longimycelium tulufanense]GGM67427.1 hypothetical protein GCM10012275_42520 [Longimycelium tulufanense]